MWEGHEIEQAGAESREPGCQGGLDPAPNQVQQLGQQNPDRYSRRGTDPFGF